MHPYYASHFSKEELINMHKYHIAIRASVDERTMPPFIAATPPPVPVVDPSYADVVRSQPNEQFGILPLAAVHEWQEKRYGDAADGGRLGRDPTPKPPPNQKPHMTKYD
jgi:hypothetical protein